MKLDIENLEESIWFKMASANPVSVTSDNLTEDEIEFLDIEDNELESFILESFEEKKFIFITGNAGDGKTHLMKKISAKCDPSILREINFIQDATVFKDQADVLKKIKETKEDNKGFCIAINESPLHRLIKLGIKEDNQIITELQNIRKNKFIYVEREFGNNVVFIDLSLRNPLEKRFVKQCLEKITNDTAFEKYLESYEVSRYFKNLNKLKLPKIRERLYELLEYCAKIGYRITFRELWIYLAGLVLTITGDKNNFDEDYFEAAFVSTKNHKFNIYEFLKNFDPAYNSLPLLDLKIEYNDDDFWKEWIDENIYINNPDDKVEFFRIKRQFYFEHNQGDEVLKIQQQPLAFVNKIKNPKKLVEYKKHLIRTINRLFTITDFQDSEIGLYIWNGHRFHEMPTKSFTSNRIVFGSNEYETDSYLKLETPKLNPNFRKAFPDYQANYFSFTLGSSNNNENIKTLNIDYFLYSWLEKARNGLSKNLIPVEYFYKVENFLNQLSRESHFIEAELDEDIETSYPSVLIADLEKKEVISVISDEKFTKILKIESATL